MNGNGMDEILKPISPLSSRKSRGREERLVSLFNFRTPDCS